MNVVFLVLTGPSLLLFGSTVLFILRKSQIIETTKKKITLDVQRILRGNQKTRVFGRESNNKV